jgi:2-methylcitrate dehydratase PrpD
MAKVSFSSPEGWGKGEVDLIAEISIRLENGEEHSHLVAEPKGEPGNPMTHEELVGKFKNCSSLVLHEKEMIRLVDLIKHIEGINELTEIFRVLRGT